MKTKEEIDAIISALFLAKVVIVVILATILVGFIVGFFQVATTAGPNCPPPVPASWLGFCDAYDLR
jgi:nitrate reductase NapE component